VGGLFFICVPQHFKPFAVFLRWVGQEDAVFAVILGGGGGPVIGTGHHTPIIKDCEFIMFNLVPAVGADGYAGGDQFINHGRFMSGHSSVGDNADMGAPTVGGDNGICDFRIGYRINGNVNGCGPTQLGMACSYRHENPTEFTTITRLCEIFLKDYTNAP